MCNLRGAICAHISLVQENNCTEGCKSYTLDYGDSEDVSKAAAYDFANQVLETRAPIK